MAESFPVGGARLLRHWLRGFILNEGIFKNIGYKRRSSRGILSDPTARTEMTWWMLTATRALPPATAKDFTKYVNAVFNSNIKQRTGQI
jgi:hypothetical protein